VNLLLDKRCQLKELNLVDNPKLGVHLRDVQDTPPAHTVTHADDDTVVDGNGCEILARAIRRYGSQLHFPNPKTVFPYETDIFLFFLFSAK
jgi:hypothetical protein